MKESKATEDKDVISQLADEGEEALRRLVEIPRRIVVGTRDGVDELLHGVAARMRVIDPLDRRLANIERRLDSLETADTGAAPAAVDARPAPTRKAAKEAGAAHEPVKHDRSHRAEARPKNEREHEAGTANDK